MMSFTALVVATLAVLAAPVAAGPAPVLLGVSGDFAILSKSGITDVPACAITGNIGSSPITGAAIHVTCSEVTGTIYSADVGGPACKITSSSMLTSAVADMGAAYNDAAGRKDPDFVNIGAGEIGGLVLTPGTYKFTSGVSINSDVVLTGGVEDVYIFQIAGNLVQAANTQIFKDPTLKTANVFWQVAGFMTVNINSHFEGIALSSQAINLKTSASVTGRLLAQTAVTLQMNTVTEP